MIMTPYYSYQPSRLSYNAGTSAASKLGLGAMAFGMGYLKSMSKEDKLAAQNKIRAVLGLPPKTPVAPPTPGTPQAPAPITTATPTPVDPSQQSADPALAGNWDSERLDTSKINSVDGSGDSGYEPAGPDSERLATGGLNSVDGSGDGGYAQSWNDDKPSNVPAPVDLAEGA